MARCSSVQDVFMLFGDSITQGAWEIGLNGIGQQLSHVYARKLDVLNRGFSGYTSEWGIPVLKQLITQSPPAQRIRILTIWFGANDACIPPSPQHVPLLKFISNLKQMISFARSFNSTSPNNINETRILLISPPPVCGIDRAADLAARDPPLQPDREFEVTRRYAQAVEQVAREEGVPFVDVWNRIWDAAEHDETGLRKFLADGLHLNEAGYAIAYEELINVISRELPDLHFDNLPFVFAPWKEIDFKDPASSLTLQK